MMRKKPANKRKRYGIIPIRMTPMLICAKKVMKNSRVPSCMKLMITADAKKRCINNDIVAIGKTLLLMNSVGSVRKTMMSRKFP